MKKIFVLGLIICSTLIFMTGCERKKSDYKLEITESGWSGWTDDYKPEEVTNTYDIVLDKEYVINEGSLGLTITIKKINKDSIVIETTTPFSEGEDGINLGTDQKKFTVKANETLKLTTPTTDAGNIYYLKLVK